MSVVCGVATTAHPVVVLSDAKKEIVANFGLNGSLCCSSDAEACKRENSSTNDMGLISGAIVYCSIALKDILERIFLNFSQDNAANTSVFDWFQKYMTKTHW